MSQKFMGLLQSNDNLRINDLKLIEQEQYYIAQLKEQREKMEMLRVEFIRKDQTIIELQRKVEKLQDECEQLRESYQDQIQNQENEIYRFSQLQLQKEDILKDNQELKDLVQHLRNENDNLNSLQLKQDEYNKSVEQRVEQLGKENSQLKQEIKKLDEMLFSLDPIKHENSKLKQKINGYKMENKKFSSEMRQSRLEINKQLDEFKQIIQQQTNEIENLQENNQQLKQKINEYECQLQECTSENQELKLEIKRFYEKEDSDIKIKSEIDRVRQDLMSVRYQEVQKLNEIFNGIFSNGRSLANSREQFN